MTSAEIDSMDNGPEEGYTNAWLKEIAYHLAVLVEVISEEINPAPPPGPKRVA